MMFNGLQCNTHNQTSSSHILIFLKSRWSRICG